VCRVSGSSRHLVLGDLALLALAAWFLGLGALVCVGRLMLCLWGVCVGVICNLHLAGWYARRRSYWYLACASAPSDPISIL
jgi:hypothetical protein